MGPNRITRCLAIGDGLNDALMMSVADVSVQIAREGMSGIHADIIAYNFNPINDIMFSYS